MADYDSAVPVRGYILDGDTVAAAEIQGHLMMGQDTSNYQAILTTTTGQVRVVVDDGYITCDAAVGSEKAILIAGSDGTNFRCISTTATGAINVALGDGYITCDAAVGSEKAILIAGTDGSNFRCILTTATGQPRVVVDDGYITCDAAVGSEKAILMAGSDGSNFRCIKTDSTGAVYVITTTADLTEDPQVANANLVKNAQTTVLNYSPSNASQFGGFIVSGSGRYKAEVSWGVTASEVLYIVGFGIPTDANFIYNFPENMQPDIAATDSVLIQMTNLEFRPSPGSDFTGYAFAMLAY